MDRQNDRQTDRCRSVEREVSGGRIMCLYAPGRAVPRGIRPPDLLLGWITAHCLPALYGTAETQSSSSPTHHWHLHLVLCTNYTAIHVEKHAFIWVTELMSSSLLISNISVAVLKITVTDILCIHKFHFFPLLLPRQFNRTNSNISEQGFLFPKY